nr:MAG TPA_asm: hypothetical protein [Caudoviricetes sp.]
MPGSIVKLFWPPELSRRLIARHNQSYSDQIRTYSVTSSTPLHVINLRKTLSPQHYRRLLYQ